MEAIADAVRFTATLLPSDAEAARAEARCVGMHRRVLASWASDYLVLRSRGMLEPVWTTVAA